MPNSHPEICASPNSLLTFCPLDISLNFSDSIHQDIWAIVEKNIQREKQKRHRRERKKKSKVLVMKKKILRDRAHMFSSSSLSYPPNKRES